MSRQPERLAEGGLIERGRRLSFSFDGTRYEGHPGDTLASALLASGVRLFGASIAVDGGVTPSPSPPRPSGWRAMPNAFAFVLGFALIFTIGGFLIYQATSPLRDHMPLLRQIGGVILVILVEDHAPAVLPGINGQYSSHRHMDIGRDAAKAGPEADCIIAKNESFHGLRADIQHDLAVLAMLARHIDTFPLDIDEQVGRHRIIQNPFVNGPDQVGTTGRHGKNNTRVQPKDTAQLPKRQNRPPDRARGSRKNQPMTGRPTSGMNRGINRLVIVRLASLASLR